VSAIGAWAVHDASGPNPSSFDGSYYLDYERTPEFLCPKVTGGGYPTDQCIFKKHP
jgi:hypothetical protein